MKDNEIKIISCTLKIKNQEIILTMEEAFQLKMELEKAFPTPPMIIREPLNVPNPMPSSPIYPWPSQPWMIPSTPCPSPYITWCMSSGETIQLGAGSSGSFNIKEVK